MKKYFHGIATIGSITQIKTRVIPSAGEPTNSFFAHDKLRTNHTHFIEHLRTTIHGQQTARKFRETALLIAGTGKE